MQGVVNTVAVPLMGCQAHIAHKRRSNHCEIQCHSNSLQLPHGSDKQDNDGGRDGSCRGVRYSHKFGASS